jgi:hypothetical protein
VAMSDTANYPGITGNEEIHHKKRLQMAKSSHQITRGDRGVNGHFAVSGSKD